jgi:ABC-type polysaccharide/polyol phosphate export permease
LRVIWALILREIITRYGRHNIGFLWIFAEPMIFTLGVTALWTFSGLSHGSNLPIQAFALTGYSTVLLWRNMPGRTINSLQPNAALMFHRNVRVLDIFVSRVALEAIGATMSFAILGTIMYAFGYIKPPEDVIKIAQGWVLTAWFGASLAIFLGSGIQPPISSFRCPARLTWCRPFRLKPSACFSGCQWSMASNLSARAGLGVSSRRIMTSDISSPST